MISTPSITCIAVLLLAPVVGFDAVIPSLVFNAANEPGSTRYRVDMVSLDGGPVDTTSGYAITPHGGLDLLAEPDTVIVPGTRAGMAAATGQLPPPIVAALDRRRPTAQLVSICTGAFVLGAAGLLDGRPATTHWQQAAQFRALHPRVRLDEDVLFVDDGDVLTSAGLAAGLDLCLHLVRRDHGAAVANIAARYCVVPPWRDGGQAQFIDRPVPDEHDASTNTAQLWALNHLDEPVSVTQLAAQAQMSPRTFNRRFREETGQSPGAWVAVQRRDRARHLLETTDLPIDEVARRAGLGSGSTLRHQLRTTLGVAPVAYRRTFRGRASSEPASEERSP